MHLQQQDVRRSPQQRQRRLLQLQPRLDVQQQQREVAERQRAEPEPVAEEPPDVVPQRRARCPVGAAQPDAPAHPRVRQRQSMVAVVLPPATSAA